MTTKNKDKQELAEDLEVVDLQDEVNEGDKTGEANPADGIDEATGGKGGGPEPKGDGVDKKKKNLDDGDGGEVEVKEAKDEDDMDDEDGKEKEPELDDGDEDEVKVEKCKKESVEMPKSSSGIIGALYEHLSGLKKPELEEAWQALLGPKQEDAGVKQEDIEESVKPDADIDAAKADLGSLMEAEESLSDEFRAKAGTILENVVRKKIDEGVAAESKAAIARLEESFDERVDREVNEAAEALSEKVDEYLTYAVNEWQKENEVELDQGLRTENAESFMKALQSVFSEHYISVPEGKEDMVVSLSTEVDELSESIKTQTERNIALAAEVRGLRRDAVLAEMSKDLAETQALKLRELTEDVDFEDAESFTKKIQTIKNAFFAETATQTTDDNDDINEEAGDFKTELSPSMQSYVDQLKKSNK